MFARNLMDELMKNAVWIRNHVGECVQTFITTAVFTNEILTIVREVAQHQQNQKDLEKRVAQLAENSIKLGNDIAKAIDCVNAKVIHEAKSRGMMTLQSLYLPLSCALLGRFIYNSCRESGFID